MLFIPAQFLPVENCESKIVSYNNQFPINSSTRLISTKDRDWTKDRYEIREVLNSIPAWFHQLVSKVKNSILKWKIKPTCNMIIKYFWEPMSIWNSLIKWNEKKNKLTTVKILSAIRFIANPAKHRPINHWIHSYLSQSENDISHPVHAK